MRFPKTGRIDEVTSEDAWGFLGGGTSAGWCGEETRWWLDVRVAAVGLLVVVEVKDGGSILVGRAVQDGSFVSL